ncbi:InlB B-repeat-containing protein [Methanimicrococcus blatticola]|uniref:InlB B-repeat-containing protein n=1 Tax=Methanimicrococcus blatticola TaxID=91560 RepID=UPI001E451D8A|nr:InlB B-repeat-containing protein [Methanimicrococcus blatticola]MCC2508657.1 InlB B-repeat-containing protein [Methanimicrococcus blatticola]
MLFPLVLGDETTATVKFYSDDKLYNTQTVTVSETVSVPTAPPLPAGMISFVGWSADKNGLENIYDFSTPVTGDMSLYAQFSDEYLISFKDASDHIYETQLVKADGYAEQPETPPVKEESLFLYWTVEDSDEIYYFDYPVNSNIVLTPNYGSAYWVSFESIRGTPVASQTVEEGKTATKPANPTREGYTFSGWSIDMNTGPSDTWNLFDFSQPITKSIILYAIWKPDPSNMPEVEVVIWKEKDGLPFEFLEMDPNNYVYHDSYYMEALAGSVVELTENDIKTMAEDKIPPASYYKGSNPTVIKENGTTIDVYYANTIYNVSFDLNGGILVKGQINNNYTAEIKSGMNLETVWPVNEKNYFYMYKNNYVFYGWEPPSNLNPDMISDNETGPVIWASTPVICTPDMLPNPGNGLRDDNFTVKANWISNSSSTNVTLNYMFEAFPGEMPTGELGVDFVIYDDKIYFRDSRYDQSTAITKYTSFFAKKIDGMEPVQKNAMKLNSVTKQLETNAIGAPDQYLLYDRLRYNLEFNAMGGDAPANMTGIPTGQPLSTLAIEAPTWAEHDFVGWYEDAGFNKPFDLNNSTMPSHNVVLYARWETDDLTATFYDKEGGTVLGTQHIASGDTVHTPEHSDPHYRIIGDAYEDLGIFKGWYHTKPNGLVVPYDFSSEAIYENIDLYGMYQVDGYKIIYDKNGGTGDAPIDNGVYKLNVLAEVKDAQLTKDNKSLAGWQEKGKPGTIYYPGSFIEMYGNVNFEAVYTGSGPLTDIIYNSNFGETPEIITDQASVGDIYQTKDENTFIRPGYYLVGWYEQIDDLDLSYIPGQTMTVPPGGATLYAHWEHDGDTFYNVTYDANTGTGGTTIQGLLPDEPYTVLDDSESGANVQKPGFNFLGWSENSTAETPDPKYDPGKTIWPADNLTLYAVWKHDDTTYYNVTYKANGGTGVDYTVAVIPGDEHTVVTNDSANIEWDGYLFIEWNTEPEGDGENHAAGDIITPTDNVTLYAVWELNNDVYTVTYDANGGAGTPPADDTEYSYDDIVTVRSDETISNPGYKFVSWNTVQNGSGTAYRPEQTFNIRQNVVLYAIWEKEGGPSGGGSGIGSGVVIENDSNDNESDTPSIEPVDNKPMMFLKDALYPGVFFALIMSAILTFIFIWKYKNNKNE